jgi:hypothetical protein
MDVSKYHLNYIYMVDEEAQRETSVKEGGACLVLD